VVQLYSISFLIQRLKVRAHTCASKAFAQYFFNIPCKFMNSFQVVSEKIFMNNFLLSEEITSAFPNYLETVHGFWGSVLPTGSWLSRFEVNFKSTKLFYVYTETMASGRKEHAIYWIIFCHSKSKPNAKEDTSVYKSANTVRYCTVYGIYII
jgi:hypothetical protein